ncbi:hypothetical protein AURDEDRAFT_165960 [Auricularia subglabra TFB-10046 SS5]|nr:hypothetical protein AURDEDRAFT_165960 [Auricularia subglabra TFB-10046 SS5]
MFRGFDRIVTVLLVCQTRRDASGFQISGATFKATGDEGRTRVAELRYSANVSRFLSHVWESNLPPDQVSHFACEFELFPALLASLPGETPIPSLELLFAHDDCPELADEMWSPCTSHSSSAYARRVRLEISPCPRLPRLRTLRLGPRNVESALCTVLSAQDIAALITSLGCMTPLENVTICRGVHVNDAGELKRLALSVVLNEDPTYWHLYS